jgi:hypothetical protein
MFESRDPVATEAPTDGGQPRKTRLRRILDEQPEARSRLGKAVAALLGTGLVAIAAIGALLIWHIVRRGRLIRERLDHPRVVPPLELPSHEVDQST